MVALFSPASLCKNPIQNFLCNIKNPKLKGAYKISGKVAFYTARLVLKFNINTSYVKALAAN